MVARSPAPSALIVDAEPYICRVFEAKLSKDGQFQVISSSSGTDALQAATQQSFDAVLWDLRLRDTTRLLPRLRALCPNAALILLTTDDRPSLSPEITRLGVTDVLVKPFGLESLVERVKQNIAAFPPAPTARVELASVGQQLTLVSPGGQCVTRVLSRAHNTFFVVGEPRVATPSDFAPGLPVRVLINGKDAQYSFASRLLRVHPYPVLRWELAMPRAIRRRQRRKHARLSVQMPAVLMPDISAAESRFASPEEPNTFAETSSPETSAMTEDIGMGGFAVVSNDCLPTGETVLFALKHEAYPVIGRGQVIHAQPILPSSLSEPEPRFRYRLRIQFTALDAGARSCLRSLLETPSQTML